MDRVIEKCGCLQDSKKSQVSIFIVIAIIIIVGFVYLVTGDVEQKIKDPILVKETVQPVNLPTDFLKKNVDMCLKTGLKRATLLAGLRGGFVFNRAGLREQYIKDNYLPTKYYNNEYLVKYKSNVGYSDEVLIWDNLQTSVPEINSKTYEYDSENRINYSALQFNHTIKEDFENYILQEFQDCVVQGVLRDDLVNVYEFNYTKYLGLVTDVDYDAKKFTISGMDYDNGDVVQFDFGDRLVNGSIDEDSIVNFGPEILLPEIIIKENLYPINLNKTPELKVDFLDSSIIATIDYPISISNEDRNIVFKDSSIVLNIRLKKILNFAERLLNYKINENRNVSYGDETDIYEEILSSYSGFYNKSIDLNQTEVDVANQSNKIYIYTLIDRNSKIDGQNFVFNFAVVNDAPTLNLDVALPPKAVEVNKDAGVITYIVPENPTESQKEFDLSSLLRDLQKTDYIGRDAYLDLDGNLAYNEPAYAHFVPFEENQGSAYFNIDRYGKMFYETSEKEINSFDIEVTDGEVSSSYIVEFLSSKLTNEGNKDAEKCFNLIQNTSDGRFPNGNYYGEKLGQNNFLYGYVSDNYINKNKLSFKSGCSYSGDDVEIVINRGETQICRGASCTINSDGDYEIDVSNDNVEKYTIDFVDSDEKTQLKEIFSITVYPVGCMGPEIGAFGGGSCCDVGALEQLDYKINQLDNRDQLVLDNLIRDIEVTDGEYYFCLDKDYLGLNSKNQVLWSGSSQTQKITSLYRGTPTFTCAGEFPRLYDNPGSISSNGNGLTGELVEVFDIESGEFDSSSSGMSTGNVNLEIVQSIGECEFCNIDVESNLLFKFNVDGRTLQFKSGMIDANYTRDDGTLVENNENMEKVFSATSKKFLTNTQWYKFENDKYDNPLNSFFGKNSLSPETNKIGRYYCKSDSKESEIKSESVVDDGCTDKYFTSNGDKVYIDNTGWDCDSKTQDDCTQNTDGGQTCVENNYKRFCNVGVCQDNWVKIE